ncbi:MAG: hypothetical protein ACJ75H_15130 [Thermoanaerobaculia bacterium]
MSGDGQEGFREALRYPFFDTLFHRRSRRISKGLRSVPAGSLSYTSTQEPQPLSPLEEALLIAATGVTGVTLPDMPFQTEEGKPLVGSPLVAIRGRSASSPDNAQATHFFLINDSGTYLLRQPKDVDPFVVSGDGGLDPGKLVAYAESCKVKVLDHRLDFPVRQFPTYVGRNRYVSNVPGSTVLVPVIDMTQQYINGIMFLLTQDEGHRPTFIDDWNLYKLAGIKKWVKSGFLNKELKLPLGYLGTFRIHIEADLLVQNLLLAIQAMGLGGWVHAAFAGPYLLGAPDSVKDYGPGLGFRFERPKPWLRRTVKAFWPLPCWAENPVGLDGLLETFTPPYYKDMNTAIDALLARKYGPQGLYRDPKNFEQVFKPGLAERFVDEVPHYSEEVIEVAKAVCTYIWETYGRFPAHVDAVYVPGVWVQAHHLDLHYYDQLYRNGYSATQAQHQRLWHGQE